jgi:nucleotide-binding universal stress UspA family protein
MKILITTDGSADARIACETALRVLSPEDRRIDILCVAPPSGNGPHHHRYDRRLQAKAAEIARSTQEQIGAVADIVTAGGSAAGVIVDRAQDYDLTVIGARSRTGTGDAGLGPVATRVVQHAMAPVLIGREMNSETGTRILAAVDGSRTSMNALETLARLCDLRDSEITLLHVSETPWIHLGGEDEWATLDDDEKDRTDAGVLEREMTREGETILDDARKLLRPTCAAVDTVIDEGNPADEILSEADRGQHDLIVVGATGDRSLKHSMLGSVSTKVAWNAPCSVLIVRQPAS